MTVNNSNQKVHELTPEEKELEILRKKEKNINPLDRFVQEEEGMVVNKTSTKSVPQDMLEDDLNNQHDEGGYEGDDDDDEQDEADLVDFAADFSQSRDAVKALGGGRVGGYLIRFTNKHNPDLQGDYFTSDTDLGKHGQLPVLYHHGQDKSVGKRVIGEATLTKQDAGIWAEAQLHLRDVYESQIYKLVQAGKLGWSSGAVSHLVEREQKDNSASWVKMWWMAEASLTPTPAEPLNHVVSVKSVVMSGSPLDVLSKTSADVTEPKNLPIKNLENDTMANEKDMDELKSQIAALTKAFNEPAEEPSKATATVKSIGKDHDGGDAFKHWLKTGQQNYYTKGNEQDWSSTKTNALNITTSTEGGILVPEGLRNSIIEKRDEASIVRRSGVMTLQTNLDSVQVPVENAKVTAAIVAEAGTYVSAEPTFTSNVVSVYKFGNRILMSEEIMNDDQTNLQQFLSNSLGRAFGLLENQYCLAGTGSSQPKGLFTGATSGVTAASSTAGASARRDALYHTLAEPYTTTPSEVCWIMRNATLGALRALASSSVFTFNSQPQGDQGMSQLYGHHVYVSGYAPASTTGLKPIFIGNPSAGAILIERQGMVMSRNPYLYQASGQVALFTGMRFGFTTTLGEALMVVTMA